MLVALLVIGFASALRRRDRAGVTTAAFGAVVLAATIWNLSYSPTKYGVNIRYFLSAWASAMFVSFCIVYLLARSFERTWVRAATLVAVPLTLLVGSVAVARPHPPRASLTTGTRGQQQVARAANRRVLAALDDPGRVSGPVELVASKISTYPYIAALAVALGQNGVDYCIRGLQQFTGSPIPKCAADTDNSRISMRVDLEPVTTTAGATITIPLSATREERGCDPADFRTWSQLDERIRTAAVALAADDRPIPVTRAFSKLFVKLEPDQATRDRIIREDIPTPSDVATSAEGRRKLVSAIRVMSHYFGISVVTLPGLDSEQLGQWARLDFGCRPQRLSITIS